MNGNRRTAIRQCLIDGLYGIATIIIDTRRSGLDAAIAQHAVFGKGICDGALRDRLAGLLDSNEMPVTKVA